MSKADYTPDRRFQSRRFQNRHEARGTPREFPAYRSESRRLESSRAIPAAEKWLCREKKPLAARYRLASSFHKYPWPRPDIGRASALQAKQTRSLVGQAVESAADGLHPRLIVHKTF